MRKKLLSVALCVAMTATALVGCGSSSDDKETTTKAPAESSGAGEETTAAGDNTAAGNKEKGKVYFLNFKPEIAEQYTAIMKKFTEETKIEAKVVTAASNQYESTLKVEMAKSDAPTLFTVNGPVGYNTWKDYCSDLKGTEFYKMLSQKEAALTAEDGVYGIPLCLETYGLICNKAIFTKYFALASKADTGCTKIEDINTFAKLKAVVEDMQKNKSELGIDGVFSKVALGSSDNWRITNHLFDLPLYYEYAKDGVSDKQTLDFTFAENYKNILDLYLDNSSADRKSASTGSVDDSMLEFASGKAAIAQNGTWAWGQVNPEKVEGSVVKAEDLYYMPIYTGAEGEEKQGLCTGTENFVCVNSQASADDQAASAYFLEWLYSSDAGKAFVSENYGVAPFEGFDNSKASDSNPLVKAALADVNNADTKTVAWVTVTTPSEDWKKALGENLLGYAEGSVQWDKVVSDAKDKWASEKSAANE